MWNTGLRLASAFLLAGLIPLAILVSRDRLRRYRRGVLAALEDWMYQNAPEKIVPSFEVARIKYELAPRVDVQSDQSIARELAGATGRGTIMSFLLPATIYSALSGLGFTTAIFLAAEPQFWQARNFILSGMQNLSGEAALTNLAAYQWNSGAAITAGFIGAYLFTLQYLVQRVRSYELSPTSFLVAAVCLLEGCFVVGIARHLLFTDAPYAAFTVLAFLLGYFPTFGISWLVEHAKVRTLKRIEPAAYNRRFVLPTDMVDGVDMPIKFRLMEAGVHDVQNLATANPVLLYVETPFELLTILDWIAQAQFIIAVGGSPAAELRGIGVRTIFDVAPMGRDPMTRRMVLEKVWPAAMAIKDQVTGTPEQFQVLLKMLNGDVHVRRLQTLWSVLTTLVGTEPGDHEAALARPVGKPQRLSGNVPFPSRQPQDAAGIAGDVTILTPSQRLDHGLAPTPQDAPLALDGR
jgi:hypothetical protein